MAALIHRLASGRGFAPTALLLALLLVILILMGRATTNSAKFGQMYAWLLVLSTLGFGALTLLIVYNLFELIRLYRHRIPGSRLTLRLASIFAVLAITPVALVYGFSLHFLQRGIDSWFNVQVDRGLEDALELSRTALDLRMREVLKQTLRIAEVLPEADTEQIGRRLDEMLDASEASELTLFGQSGRIIGTATVDSTLILPDPPPDTVLLHVRQGHNYVGLEPMGATGFHIRVLVPAGHSANEQRQLQALFPVTDRLSLLADAVQAAFDSYRELIFLRAPLRASFTLTLSLVLLLAVLAALWAAFYTARRLVRPLRELADGTQAVAAGQYNKQLAGAGSDELGFLVGSFNDMTRNLAQARDAAQRSQALVESQRAYLETVLARLSSGVIIIDQSGRLQTCNAAANQMLGINLHDYVGADSEWIAIAQPSLQDFLKIIGPHLGTTGDWREEVNWFGAAGRCILLCRGSSLPDAVGLRGGHVIVFDDVTNLVRAERDAAWSEVARRLAHEIKNPLTPIQLAAERIRHKYLNKQLDEEQGKVLDRGTHTIIQQVQAMKEMVDAFNEYARPPRLQLAPLELNDFVTEVLYLYRDYPAGVEIKLDLTEQSLWINGDKVRLRQLLHNLVKNAIEALRDGRGSMLSISTRLEHVAGGDCVEIGVRDNGPGFPDHILASAFEPYVTTKPKGTGLGLAIVKKIVEEHGGWIQLETPTDGGASVIIRLPIRHNADDTHDAATQATDSTVSLHTDQEAAG
jgi:nitrogen fixation/metabolism regulation signal transduction histidine kinase